MTWEKRCLGELCSLFTDGDWIETKDQSISGIRLIQTGNVGESIFKNRLDKARWITQSKFDELKCQEVLPGDILISRLPDPVGRACIIPQLGVKCITGVDCSIVRLSHEIDANWFIRYSQSKAYQAQIESSVTGTTRKRISRKNLGKVEIPLPPLDEQKRIAGILDEADQVRKKTQALIDKYDELAQSLFLDMFGDPVTNPKGWEVKPLGSFQEIKSGGTPKRGVSGFYSPKEVPWVKTGDLKPMFLRATTEWISHYGLESSAAKLFPKNTLLIAMYGATIGASSILGIEASTNQACAALLPCESYDVTFEYYLFKQIRPRLIALGEGGAQPNISASILKAMKLPIPPIETQKKFAKRVAEIMHCRKHVATSSYPDDLFNALLQKAFTGELT